jgi:transposase-like protein
MNSVFAGFRFPPQVITIAVRWSLRYGLSYRDVEELLASTTNSRNAPVRFGPHWTHRRTNNL